MADEDQVFMECEETAKDNGSANKRKRKQNKEELPTEQPDKKKKRKVKCLIPSITYDIDELFSNNGKRPGGSRLNFRDIHQLMMMPIHGEIYPNFPTWCRITAWQQIKKAIVIMAGCVSEEDYFENKECFKYLNAEFPKPVPVRGEGSDLMVKSPLESFLRYRVPTKLMALKKSENGKVHQEILSAHQYVLNDNQLRTNEYPEWNSSAKEHGLVTTRRSNQRVPPSESSKLLAVDCEMCTVLGGGRALTRISVVDSDLKTIYDKYVKPDIPIVDYLTEFSGITAKLLEDIETKLCDVQKDLLEIIEPETILVGHSLDFDLRAMEFHHDNIIDTSILYEDQRGPRYKSSLKFLVKTYLKRDIQISDKGHCSIEDAKSCMELVLLKIQKGSSFASSESDCESIYEALSRVGKRGALIDSAPIVRQHCHGNHHCIPCTSDDQVVSSSQRMVNEVDFVFSHLKEYENLIKGTDPVTEELKEKIFINLDNSISKILSAVPSPTLVIISLSSGYMPPDIMKMARDKEQRKCDVVKETVKKARHGLCFVKLT